MYRSESRGAFDALVIGRGAVGAAAALGLARAGLRVAVVAPGQAASAGPAGPDAWDPRVFAVSPASRALLERLRVWDALDASRVAPVYDMRIYPSGREGAPELHFGAYEACVEALAWIVEGANLTTALERGLSFAGVEEIDGRVESIDTSAPDHAALALAGGRVLRARLVVGADGARSPVRGMLGIAATERDYPQQAVVANFETGLPHRDCAWQWFGEHGILALLPLPGQRASMVWSAPRGLAAELLGLDPEALAERVAQASWHVLGGLRVLTPAQAFPLRLVRVERCIAPRAVLVGDAAHVVHPLSGQGMNLGFGDVAALLDVIAGRESFRDLGDPLLLRRYERARREAVATMRLTTDGLQRLFDDGSGLPLPGPLRPLVGARELGWRLVASSAWLKRRLIAHAAS
jgi:ubiquinone biosynthesis UbiH/UbiF/VisC/COQ6 family hydroxylase